MSDTGASDSPSLESSIQILSLRLDFCFLGGAISESDESGLLSLGVAIFPLDMILRFLAIGVPDPEGFESQSWDLWNLALVIRLDSPFDVTSREDEVECDRLGSK